MPDYCLTLCTHDGNCNDSHPTCINSALTRSTFPNGTPARRHHHHKHAHDERAYYENNWTLEDHLHAGKITKEQIQKIERFFNKLSGKQKQAMIALGVGAALLIPGVAFTLSATMTAMTIGPIGEAIALEFFVNSTFMHAAARAGLMVAGGKSLNVFGIFGYAKVIDQASLASIKGWTKERVVERALDLGLVTEKDKLLLWSGMGDGIKISQDFARANGLQTLEMTKGGRWLNNLDLFNHDLFTREETRYIWKQISLATVKQAKGKINAIVGTVSDASIYAAEKEAAHITPAVTYIDEMSILPVIRHKR